MKTTGSASATTRSQQARTNTKSSAKQSGGVAIIPPMRPLPDIRFVWAETRLAGSGQPALRRSLWALKRWRIETVRVIGRAALNEKGRRTLALARARTELIAEQLHAAGLKAEAAWDSPAFQQKNREKAQGQTAWCVVRLQPVFETGGVRAGPAVKS
jgi:hypothetical protein